MRQNAAAFHKLGEDCNKLRVLVTQLSTQHAALQHRVNAIKEKIIKVNLCLLELPDTSLLKGIICFLHFFHFDPFCFLNAFLY